MATSNGTTTAQRKSLSSQLDRLDRVLDGFADNLNEAVADSIKEIVGEVVQTTIHETVQSLIREVLGNPTILNGLRQTLRPMDNSAHSPTGNPESQVSQSPAQPPKVTWRSRVWSWAARTVASHWGTCCGLLKAAWGYTKLAWHHRWSVLSLSGIAVGVGLGSYLLSPVLSAIMAGIGGASLAVLITGLLAFRHVLSSVGTLESFLSTPE